MDVIRINTNLLKLYFITLFNFLTYGVESLFPVRLAKDTPPILHWGNKVIVQLRNIVL